MQADLAETYVSGIMTLGPGDIISAGGQGLPASHARHHCFRNGAIASILKSAASECRRFRLLEVLRSRENSGAQTVRLNTGCEPRQGPDLLCGQYRKRKIIGEMRDRQDTCPPRRSSFLRGRAKSGISNAG